MSILPFIHRLAQSRYAAIHGAQPDNDSWPGRRGLLVPDQSVLVALHQSLCATSSAHICTISQYLKTTQFESISLQLRYPAESDDILQRVSKFRFLRSSICPTIHNIRHIDRLWDATTLLPAKSAASAIATTPRTAAALKTRNATEIIQPHNTVPQHVARDHQKRITRTHTSRTLHVLLHRFDLRFISTFFCCFVYLLILLTYPDRIVVISVTLKIILNYVLLKLRRYGSPIYRLYQSGVL